MDTSRVSTLRAMPEWTGEPYAMSVRLVWVDKERPYVNLDDIRKDTRTKYWFNAAVNFRTRYCGQCITNGDLTYFVTSERQHASLRLYTVRYYDSTTGEINNVSEFGQFRSRDGAVGWLNRFYGAPSMLLSA